MSIKLGTLIRQLSACKPDSRVVFDFCRLVPRGVDSSRGHYDQLAIGWANDVADVTVTALLTELRDAIGKTFEGYKGGEFVMNEETEVWVDNWGRWTGTAITHVEDDDFTATICTESA